MVDVDMQTVGNTMYSAKIHTLGFNKYSVPRLPGAKVQPASNPSTPKLIAAYVN